MKHTETVKYRSWRMGYVRTDTAGNETFIENNCHYCQLTTDGEHDYRCPNYSKRTRTIPDNQTS
jgi:hypothetical protein